VVKNGEWCWKGFLIWDWVFGCVCWFYWVFWVFLMDLPQNLHEISMRFEYARLQE
jgi:hypothetical protein